MQAIYSLGGRLVHLCLRLASLCNPKAKQIVNGRRESIQRIRRVRHSDAPLLWIHASSLGEFEQGRPIIEAWRTTQPTYQIVQSFFSPSGYTVRHSYAGADTVVYLPTDSTPAVRAYLDALRPNIAIFVKYDLWPTMLSELKARQIPTYLISALFQQNQIYFRPWGGWYLTLLKGLQHIYVQDEDSRKLLLAHGVHKVSVVGDTRFDRVCSLAQDSFPIPAVETLRTTAQHLLIAGSTWPADESLLLEYFHQRSDIKLVIAPHEVDEAHIQQICSQIQRPYLRYSQLRGGEDLGAIDCLVIDTIGLLSSVYRYADVAYIGGGFGRGIHNTLEAAVWGVPLLFGPNYSRFKEAQDLVALGAAKPISSIDELRITLDTLLNTPRERKQAGQVARDYVHQSRGATERIVQNLSQLA